MWRPTVSSDEIWHHGIQGMHWGKRNGPPYPLDSKTHNRIVKGQNRTGKRSAKTETKSMEKQGLIAEIALVVGLNLLPYAVLAAISVPFVIADEIKRRRETVEERKFRKQCDVDRKNAETDSKTGLKLKANKDMSREEDSKRVNPDYKLDPERARMNCVNCTTAYELRRRGFEVEAQKRTDGRNGVDVAKNVFNAPNKKVMMYPDPEKDRDKFIDYCLKYENLARTARNTELSNATYKALKKEPKGSRGQLLITWGRWGGHSVVYEVDNKGKVNIIDTQCNKIYSEAESKELFARGIAIQYQRYDNRSLNVEELKKGNLVR